MGIEEDAMESYNRYFSEKMASRKQTNLIICPTCYGKKYIGFVDNPTKCGNCNAIGYVENPINKL